MAKRPPRTPTPAGQAADPASLRPLLVDIALRAGAALARRALGARLAKGRDSRQVNDILAGRGVGKAVATAALTRLGVPSAPRALLVGAIVIAGSLAGRRRRKRRAAEPGTTAETP